MSLDEEDVRAMFAARAALAPDGADLLVRVRQRAQRLTVRRRLAGLGLAVAAIVAAVFISLRPPVGSMLQPAGPSPTPLASPSNPPVEGAVVGRWTAFPEYCPLALGMVEFAATAPTVTLFSGQVLTYTQVDAGWIRVAGFPGAAALDIRVQGTQLTVDSGTGALCTLRRFGTVESAPIIGEWVFDGNCFVDGVLIGTGTWTVVTLADDGIMGINGEYQPYGMIGTNRIVTARPTGLWEATFSVSANLITLESARFVGGPQAWRAQTVTGTCTLHRPAG